MKIYNLAFLCLFLFAFVCNQAPERLQAFHLTGGVQKQKRDTAGAPIMVFRSADGGQTWQDISEGLPKTVKEDYGQGKNVSFADANGLYLTDGHRLYHNKPNATVPFWTQENFPDEHASITPGKTGIITYNHEGGILQKTAGTSKWSPIYPNFQQKKVRAVFESAAGSIFIGTDGGLFKSTDNGKTWKQVHTAGFVTKIVESNGVLMAVNNQGIIRSTDEGEKWDLVVNEHRRGHVIESIKGGFAVGFDKTASDTRRVRTTYNGGKTWQSIDAGLPADLSIASIIQVGENFFCSQPTGVFRSTDSGKTWTLLLPSIKGKVFNLYVSGNMIYAMPRTRGC
jgi:photosystem II stability/assembly factor-like uncharacterized protein